MAYYLGIDLGTSGLKAVVLCENGTVAGVGYTSYNIDIPAPGYAQQNPEVWWNAMRCAIARSLTGAGITAKELSGIGFSGQMHGLVLLDGNHALLHDAIIWCDQRSVRQCTQIRERIGVERLGEWVQNSVSPGFQVCSLLWLREEMSDLYARIRHALLPKDYLRLRLVGEMGTEPSDASSTLLFDCAHERWSAELLRELDIDAAIMPDCAHRPTDIAGYVTPRAAKELGLAAGIPVVFGGGDQPMQAIANGILKPGDVSVTLGTGGQIFVPTAEPKYDPLLRTHTFCHAPQKRWYVMGATLSACLSQNWLLKKVLRDSNYKAMDVEAAATSPGCGGLIFLPYLTGDRTPNMDPYARGIFFGVTLQHDRGAIVRSVMEGVAFSLLDAMNVIMQSNLTITRLVLSGGGGSSPLWQQIIADVFEQPIHTTQMREEAGVGAAVCAMIGCGVFASLDEACAAIVRYDSKSVQPQPSNFAVYRKQYEIYKKLYQQNASLFKAL